MCYGVPTIRYEALIVNDKNSITYQVSGKMSKIERMPGELKNIVLHLFFLKQSYQYFYIYY